MALEGKGGEIMAHRRYALLGGSLLAVFFLICGVAFAAKSYPDRVDEYQPKSGS